MLRDHFRLLFALCAVVVILFGCAEGADEAGKLPGGGSETPTTQITPTEQYHDSQVTVTLTCTDADSDCSNTYYTIDGSQPIQSDEYKYSTNVILPLPVSTGEDTVVKYFSVDQAGHVESVQTKTYTYDSEPPDSVTINPPPAHYSSAQTISFDCTDTVSGCRSIHYSTDGGITFTELPDGDTFTIDSNVAINYYAEDNAVGGDDGEGNVTSRDTAVYTFDDAVATAPVTNFIATGRDASVELRWNNPTDADFAGVEIRRNTSAFSDPPLPNEGNPLIITSDNSTSYDDDVILLDNGTQYFYAIFAYDTSSNYSVGVSSDTTPNVEEHVPTLSPLDGATDVSPITPQISATFTTTNIFGSSFEPAVSLTLTSADGTPIPGSASHVNPPSGTITFTVTDSPLALLRTYTPRLSSNLLNETGSTPLLAADKLWDFTTAEGSWSLITEPLLSHGDLGITRENSTGPRVDLAKDSMGYAIAVWAHRGLAPRNVYANRFNVEAGIDVVKAGMISDGFDSASNPAIAMDTVGNAAVVWVQASKIWGTRYVASGVGWQVPAVQIQSTALVGSASSPTVAMNDSGDIIIVWQQSNTFSGSDIVAKTFNFTDAWSELADPSITPIAELIEWDNGDTGEATVVVASTGDALVAWRQQDSTSNYNVYYNRYTVGTGWDQVTSGGTNAHAALDDTTVYSASKTLQLVIDGNDNVIAVWDEIGKFIRSRRYSFGLSQWTALENVGFVADPTKNEWVMNSPPHVAMNKTGTALLVWVQRIDASYATYINKYEPGKGWKGYTTFEDINPNSVVIDVDPVGNALVVMDTGGRMRGYRYKADSNWVTLPITVTYEQLEDITNSNPAHYPHVVVDSKGRGVAIWVKLVDYTTTGYSVRGNRFVYRTP